MYSFSWPSCYWTIIIYQLQIMKYVLSLKPYYFWLIMYNLQILMSKSLTSLLQVLGWKIVWSTGTHKVLLYRRHTKTKVVQKNKILPVIGTILNFSSMRNSKSTERQTCRHHSCWKAQDSQVQDIQYAHKHPQTPTHLRRFMSVSLYPWNSTNESLLILFSSIIQIWSLDFPACSSLH